MAGAVALRLFCPALLAGASCPPGCRLPPPGHGQPDTQSSFLAAWAQWAEVIVPRQHIQFSRKDGRPVKLGSGARCATMPASRRLAACCSWRQGSTELKCLRVGQRRALMLTHSGRRPCSPTARSRRPLPHAAAAALYTRACSTARLPLPSRSTTSTTTTRCRATLSRRGRPAPWPHSSLAGPPLPAQAPSAERAPGCLHAARRGKHQLTGQAMRRHGLTEARAQEF